MDKTLSSLKILPHFGGGYYTDLYFTSGETEAEKLSNLPKIRREKIVGPGLTPKRSAPRKDSYPTCSVPTRLSRTFTVIVIISHCLHPDRHHHRFHRHHHHQHHHCLSNKQAKRGTISLTSLTHLEERELIYLLVLCTTAGTKIKTL